MRPCSGARLREVAIARFQIEPPVYNYLGWPLGVEHRLDLQGNHDFYALYSLPDAAPERAAISARRFEELRAAGVPATYGGDAVARLAHHPLGPNAVGGMGMIGSAYSLHG